MNEVSPVFWDSQLCILVIGYGHNSKDSPTSPQLLKTLDDDIESTQACYRIARLSSSSSYLRYILVRLHLGTSISIIVALIRCDEIQFYAMRTEQQPAWCTEAAHHRLTRRLESYSSTFESSHTHFGPSSS